MFGDRCQDVQREPGRMRVIRCHELHVGIVHELRQERDVAAQPISLAITKVGRRCWCRPNASSQPNAEYWQRS
jgi:hypothetical protein